MPSPPKPTQKRYRGRIRHSMHSALNHLERLYSWNVRYLAKPLNYYPNQLASAGEIAVINSAIIQLQAWIADRGPIPSR